MIIFPAGLDDKVCLQCWRCRFDPWVGKILWILWRRKWQPTPVFLLRKSHGQMSLVGYNPRGCKESDTTEQLKYIHTNQHVIIYSLEVLLSQFWNNPLFHVQSLLLLLVLHIHFSGGRLDCLVFLSLEEFFTVLLCWLVL